MSGMPLEARSQVDSMTFMLSAKVPHTSQCFTNNKSIGVHPGCGLQLVLRFKTAVTVKHPRLSLPGRHRGTTNDLILTGAH